MLTHLLKDFINFWQKPDDNQYNYNLLIKIKAILLLFLTNTVVTLVVIYPFLNELNNVLGIEYALSEVPYHLEILLILLIAPLTEELLFRFILRYKVLKSLIKKSKWPKIFRCLSYLSLLSFALLHLTNIDNSTTLTFILSPLLVSPQLILGMVTTFIRVRLNFIWGCIYHCSWNLLVFLIFEI